jgi:signal transduction histidine kinase
MAAHPLAVDVILAVALTTVSVVQGLGDDDPARWRPFDGLAVALTALATLPTVARRRAPTTVFLLCSAFWFGQAILGYNPAVTTYGVLLAFYTLAATRPWHSTAAALALIAGLWTCAGVANRSASLLALILQGVVIPAVIWKVADSARQLDASNRQLAQVNERLVRDREERARRAVVDEQVRIARELHDVLAHHMSVVAVQAGLARYVLRSDPDTAYAAIGTVLDTSSEALDEMRRMLTLLRVGAEAEYAEPGSYDPAPGLANLPELFSRVRAAGVPVEVRVTGEPQPLSPGVELCAYRVIQEGLTNVLKHAAPASAFVDLHHGANEFVAVVRDDGDSPDRSAAVGDTGHGLIGMRERAMLYGGTLHAGPLPGRGFEVRFALPVTAAGHREIRAGGPT